VWGDASEGKETAAASVPALRGDLHGLQRLHGLQALLKVRRQMLCVLAEVTL